MTPYQPEEKTYYIQHQAGIRGDHTTSKLRAVYDGSSKLKGPSLNDCLEAGESKSCLEH